jgi:hypothetical protein
MKMCERIWIVAKIVLGLGRRGEGERAINMKRRATRR